MTYFLVFQSTPLVYTAFFVPVPYCTHYFCSVDNLGLGLVKSLALLFLFRMTLSNICDTKAEGRKEDQERVKGPRGGGEGRQVREHWDRENVTMKSLQCMLTEIMAVIIINRKRKKHGTPTQKLTEDLQRGHFS